jgi:RND family efflux transporter MFP subunit
MPLPRKILALTAGATLALSVATIAPIHAQQPAESRGSAGDIIQDTEATIEFLEKSQVAPLIEGNLESVELEIGNTVEKNGTIGFLYKRKAELTLAKAVLAAKNVASIEKAVAQKEQAVSVVARNDRMIRRDALLVPKEDQEKALADLKVAIALIKEAEEQQALARAEVDLAQNQVDEHTIKAPFSGVILKWLKKPGESVSAREPVVEMGNLDKLRVFAYIPLENVYRVKPGTLVEYQPRISGGRGGLLPVEQKKFRGVVTFVDPQVQAINETAVKVYAEIRNESHEIQPGMKGTLTIHLNTPGDPPTPTARAARSVRAEPVIPASTASAPAPGTELPPLPPR